ncbi:MULTISPECIES: B12-binding domain-containing radical SAM protein [unclassified Peribacillus]|uniref:B12-binding domain-containing radical SAM protein n=1 Tax=unclassified Peribacillus TaxID=2675266 RepID=UPI0019130347|nr:MULTISPECIES: B12-binding domain-containing radical SAM protein [unclassified Peribacillus]MBK5445685.1 B12-binding domain-containing radical SAM protein [Peribacillus sp. TH24]MBK5459599.1 B12-binding domain-containing radical SAM protein [Peribacillus sp. TH27]
MNIIISTLNAKYIHTSLSIRYLKAYAQPDYDVQLAEYTIKDPIMNIVGDLYSKKPDVIGFSCYIWNIEETMKVVAMLKKINPELVIILGGPEVTYDVGEWLDQIPGADFIVIGEGEVTFKALLSEIEGANDYKKVGGIAYRQDGKKVIQPQNGKVDLKSLPTPYRLEEDRDELSKRVTYIETSRGCPFSCQFCLSSIEVGVRYFDREKIKEDIRYLMENGAKTIKFVDRTFNISRSYAMDMFQFLIDEHHPGVVFQFEITADIMRPEVIQFLNDHAPAGLFRFEIGVQSTNDHTNDLVMRRQNFEKLTRTVTMVKDGQKIDQHLDLIAGLPEEDYLSFRKTFNDVFELRPEEMQLGFLKMLRGTGLRIRANDHDYIYSDHAPYEILGNNVLSFDDIVRIKQVEDVLEKYWNDHRMDHTTEFLVESVFNSPFDFFQEFGTFWDEQGWSRIGHQLEDLFRRLQQFLSSRESADLKTIIGLMKLDYFMNQKYKPRKPWWDASLDKQGRKEIYEEILNKPEHLGSSFIALGLNEKEIHKHTLLEELPFDLETYLADGTIVNKPSIMLAYFDPSGKGSSIFSLSKSDSIIL